MVSSCFPYICQTTALRATPTMRVESLVLHPSDVGYVYTAIKYSQLIGLRLQDCKTVVQISRFGPEPELWDPARLSQTQAPAQVSTPEFYSPTAQAQISCQGQPWVFNYCVDIPIARTEQRRLPSEVEN